MEQRSGAGCGLTEHNQAIRKHFDRLAPDMSRWRRKSWYYHSELERFCRSVIPPGADVLEVGSGTGELLAAVEPRRGVGVDISPEQVAVARARFPQMTWVVGEAESIELEAKFDYVILSDLLGHVEDVWAVLQHLKRFSRPDTRIIVTYYNYLWEPALKFAELVGLRTPLRMQNWLPVDDIANLVGLCDFEVVKKGHRFLAPKYIPGVSTVVNRAVAKLPLVRRFGLMAYLVARPRTVSRSASTPTCSVVVPCRNERDNIEPAVLGIPDMGAHTEIIFVDGASTDGTREKIEEMIQKYGANRDIKLVLQDTPRGKGDAVRLGFEAAAGDILFILDADLTVDPVDLPKFYQAIVEGKGELVTGSRLVYPMERQAMRFLNLVGNKFFSVLFTWILEQRITDTLCGTKVIRRDDYLKIKTNRRFFGDFDPFGDFDLLFGAAKLNLKIVEIPVRYRERMYGITKISRWRHGALLLRMSWLGIWKLKLA